MKILVLALCATSLLFIGMWLRAMNQNDHLRHEIDLLEERVLDIQKKILEKQLEYTRARSAEIEQKILHELENR